MYGITTQVASPENLGYFGAANFALNTFPDLYSFDYVAISNTDVCFQLVDVLSRLQDAKHGAAEVGAIAPRLIRANGTEVPQLHYAKRPKPSKYSKLARITSTYYLGAAHRIAADAKRAVLRSHNRVDLGPLLFAPHGAFMILTQKYLANTEGFKHPTFLFNEEIFVGVQCERADLACIYDPNIVYSHRNHGSMGSVPSRTLISYLHESHIATVELLR